MTVSMLSRKESPRYRPGRKPAAAMAFACVLVLTVANAGCFEAVGKIEVFLAVGETAALGDFSRLTFAIRETRAKSQGQNPLTLDPVTDRVDVLDRAGKEPYLVARASGVTPGFFNRVDLLIYPPDAILKNGTAQAVYAINDVLLFEFAYVVEKDKTTSVVLAFNLVKTNTTEGPFYLLVEETEHSGVG